MLEAFYFLVSFLIIIYLKATQCNFPLYFSIFFIYFVNGYSIIYIQNLKLALKPTFLRDLLNIISKVIYMCVIIIFNFNKNNDITFENL